MYDLSELVSRWCRGWVVARGLDPIEHVRDGLRVRCNQPSRDVEIIALRADDDAGAIGRLAALLGRQDGTAWLTVPTTTPIETATALRSAGLKQQLDRAERLMDIDLRRQPLQTLAGRYRLHTTISGAVIRASVFGQDGQLAATGTMAVVDSDAVADRIETMPAHRRQGLGTAVMSELVQTAIEQGARRGLLVASADGQHLYRSLGWQRIADVLIAA